VDWQDSELLAKAGNSIHRAPAYEKGLTKFPVLIAVTPDNPGVPLNRAAWAKLKTFDKPFLTLYGAKDIVAPGADARLQKHIPGAAGQAHEIMPTAKHFIQEDEPQWLVERLIRFMQIKS
jgi:haloalkane dehalogenase